MEKNTLGMVKWIAFMLTKLKRKSHPQKFFERRSSSIHSWYDRGEKSLTPLGVCENACVF